MEEIIYCPECDNINVIPDQSQLEFFYCLNCGNSFLPDDLYWDEEDDLEYIGDSL